MEIIKSYIESIKLDFWTLWGLTGQSFFFLRQIIQWLKSEKAKQTVVPMSFWWLGLGGAAMLLIYSLVRKDIVFFITSILQSFFYMRNLSIAHKHDEKGKFIT